MSFHPNLMLPEIVLPHLNWRGAYESGAFLSTGGPKGRCIAEPTHEPNDWEGIYIPSPSNPDDNQTSPGPDSVYFCVEVSWPAQSQWMTHLERPLERGANGPRNWMGSLIEGGKDVSGQMYMRNRYYDPSTGKFTQEDPIGLAGGLNTYGFANGDPVSYSDPYGLSASCPDYVERGESCEEGQEGDGTVERHDRCEVASILTNYIAALGSNPRDFADGTYPGAFDPKFGKTADDLFQVGNEWLRADQFGNFAAGYAGQHTLGTVGYLAMLVGGIWYASEKGSGEHWSDSDSRPMISAGAARARLEQSKDGRTRGTRGVGARDPGYVAPLTSTAGCSR
jgi:RHS repeat-associated protein